MAELSGLGHQGQGRGPNPTEGGMSLGQVERCAGLALASPGMQGRQGEYEAPREPAHSMPLVLAAF